MKSYSTSFSTGSQPDRPSGTFVAAKVYPCVSGRSRSDHPHSSGSQCVHQRDQVMDGDEVAQCRVTRTCSPPRSDRETRPVSQTDPDVARDIRATKSPEADSQRGVLTRASSHTANRTLKAAFPRQLKSMKQCHPAAAVSPMWNHGASRHSGTTTTSWPLDIHVTRRFNMPHTSAFRPQRTASWLCDPPTQPFQFPLELHRKDRFHGHHISSRQFQR